MDLYYMFSFFSIMLILFNTMNYYSLYNKALSLSSIKTSIKTLVCKW